MSRSKKGSFEKEISENIARFLIKKRKEVDISQNKLSKKIGVSQSILSRLESNSTLSDLCTMILIAKYFNVSIDEVVDIKKLKAKG